MIPNKILLFGQNWLGDVLFSTPAIRAVRKKYPGARIACLVPPRAEAVLKNNANVDEVIVYGDRISFFSALFWKTVFRLRAARFDTALFFHRSKTRQWLACFAGIKNRWGFRYPGRKNLLTKAVDQPPDAKHRIDYFLHLVEALGIPPAGRLMDFNPDPKASVDLKKIFAQACISQNEPYIVVHAGGNWGLKRWPVEYFSQWIYYFLEKYPWRVILCGTRSEEDIARKILAQFPRGEVVSFCGKTSVDALALLLKDAKLLLSNDSGPIHLAASQKTKIVGVFGPTSAEYTGPVSDAPMKILQKDVGCQVPCYFESCDYRVCMDFLRPLEVFRQTQSLLGSP